MVQRNHSKYFREGVTWRFFIQRADTSQNTRQFALRFYTKSGTLCVTRFLWDFWNWWRGEGHFYRQKTMHFALRFYLQKVWHFVLHFYIQKRRTLRYVFISKIYRMVLNLDIKARKIRSGRLSREHKYLGLGWGSGHTPNSCKAKGWGCGGGR